MRGGHTPIHIQRWAPADYHADEHVQLLEARRDYRTLTFYRHFLDFAFVGGGDLPADPEALAAIVRMPCKDVERALAYCLGRLIVQEGTRLFQRRVKREVNEELAFRTTQSEFGRKGGRPRNTNKEEGGPKGTLLDSKTPPTPAPNADAMRHAPTPAPNGESAVVDPLRCPDCGNNNAVIQGRKEFGGGWVCWRKEGGCGQVFDLHDPAIWKQLGPKAIASIGARIARESGNGGGPLVQDYENIKPEDHVLFEIRGVLAAEFVTWFQEHPEAGFLAGQRDMGTAFTEWPRRSSLPLWIAAVVLREAVELSKQAVEVAEEKPA